MLEPTEEGDYESLHLANFDRRYQDNNNEDTKMPDVKHITRLSDSPISEHTTFSQLRSGIESAWSGFKFI